MKLDRVKVVNGMCSTTSSNEIENIHLLNVLNWSPLEDLVIDKSSTTIIKEENQSKFKHSYSPVQLSIELQKKMLK
jgi:hypothetical protein